MPIAIGVLLRSAIPWVAATLGGYVVSDWFNERQKAKQANPSARELAIIQNALKQNNRKYMLLGIGALLVGVVVVLLNKKLK